MSRGLAEAAFDHAGIFDPTVDRRGRVHAVIENDGHLAMKISLGEGTKCLGCFSGQCEIDLVLARIIGVSIFDGAAQVAASYGWCTAEQIPVLGSSLIRIAAADVAF